jgi:hypothetical protein
MKAVESAGKSWLPDRRRGKTALAINVITMYNVDVSCGVNTIFLDWM